MFLYYNSHVGRKPFGLRLNIGKGKRLFMNRRKANLLLSLGCALMLAACGDGEAVHTNADMPAEETISEEAEPSEEGGETAVEEAEPSGDAEETAAEEGEPSGDAGEAAADADLTPPIEMDETLRNELAEEMLQENEMDTFVVESAPVTKGCSFTLPEDFSESEDIEGMYVTKRYPIDASTIYHVALGRDVALQLMTEETFKAQAEENFRKEYGEDIEVHIDSFERIHIDGCPAFRILCHYQVGDTQMSQLEYAINADKSYVITYSQTDDYDRMEEYEASAETIHLEF